MRIAIFFSLLLAACHFSPDFGDGDFPCSAKRECPPRYTCLDNDRCYKDGEALDASASVDGMSGDGAVDGAVTGDGATNADLSPPPCMPTSCMAQFKNCGAFFDGCETVSCGTCTSGTCAGGGVPNVCGSGMTCVPRTCAAVGSRCGMLSDLCSDVITCACTGGQICSLDDAHCCTPNTCAPGECGKKPDGCGGVVTCSGSCTGLQYCGGGGPNKCGGVISGCTKTSCAAQMGANCGYISDGCASVLQCGTCTAPQSCGGAGTSNHCG